MFDFSGKGNVGLTARGSAPQETYTRPDPVPMREGKGIQYWYEYATTLSNGVKGLIDERDEARRYAAERKAIDAGLRAVIRACLHEIRKANPNHPLLDKKVRDRIFAEFEKEEMKKVLGDMKMWEPRELPDANQSP